MNRILTQTFGVAGAVIEREGSFLLVKEAHEGLDQGKWSHPAGWIDVGESPIEAVKREVQEESGFSFIPERLLGVYSLVRNDIENGSGEFPHAIKIIFTGSISNEPVSELEGDTSSVKWFTSDDIYKMGSNELRDGDIKVMVKEYLSGKSFSLDAIVHIDSNIFWKDGFNQ